jgi:hypothetical protein
MRDSQVMHVLNCSGNLFDDNSHFPLHNFPLLPEPLVEGAPFHILQHNEQMGFVVKKTVHG